MPFLPRALKMPAVNSMWKVSGRLTGFSSVFRVKVMLLRFPESSDFPAILSTMQKNRLSEQDVSFEDLLSDLEASRRTIEKMNRLKIAAYKKEAETLKQAGCTKIRKSSKNNVTAIIREAK